MEATRKSFFTANSIFEITQRFYFQAGKLLNLIIPGTCLICDNHVTEQGGCCPGCWSRLRLVEKPICKVMGTPFSVNMGENFLSAEAIANPPPFSRLRCVMLYDELARRLVSSLKFSDRTDLAPWLADWMSVSGQELLKDADLILPIPLHRERLRYRRFNQSAELARRLARISDIPYCPEYLVRKKATEQQVGLTQKARERNVSGAFLVPEVMKAFVKGKRVLLVDDVYTTGATAKAATRALLRGGALSVDVLVFAKVETRDTDIIYADH